MAGTDFISETNLARGRVEEPVNDASLDLVRFPRLENDRSIVQDQGQFTVQSGERFRVRPVMMGRISALRREPNLKLTEGELPGVFLSGDEECGRGNMYSNRSGHPVL